ncbi:hypothetical protein MUK42_13365 [Musa troglodytarum]|uniref:Uncharacterized protein n=1 Tax=Musa troglodytarum TaxID=320322 RepID=A0A9E7KMZ4_9LILI|nr:hypothetical protein MUK42_13365 [Musa troglodytarum]
MKRLIVPDLLVDKFEGTILDFQLVPSLASFPILELMHSPTVWFYQIGCFAARHAGFLFLLWPVNSIWLLKSVLAFWSVHVLCVTNHYELWRNFGFYTEKTE